MKTPYGHKKNWSNGMNGMNEIERSELAAKKVIDVMNGGLEGLVTLQLITLPDPREPENEEKRLLVTAVCFPADIWNFDGKKFTRRALSQK